MKTIWKVQLWNQNSNLIKVSLPSKAKFLSVQMQNDLPVAWFLVETENAAVERHFRIYGTGWPIDEANLNYLGTIQDRSGFVWHVMEI